MQADLEVFLPPIGGVTVYVISDIAAIADANKPVAVRVDDECNGSDVFGSDICTCRPYLVHGIKVCVQTAPEGNCLLSQGRPCFRRDDEVSSLQCPEASRRRRSR